MSDNENGKPTFEERLDDLAKNTAITLKIHADMIVSVDTKLHEIAEHQAYTDRQVEKLTGLVQQQDEAATRAESKIGHLADIATSFFKSP